MGRMIKIGSTRYEGRFDVAEIYSTNGAKLTFPDYAENMCLIN